MAQTANAKWQYTHVAYIIKYKIEKNAFLIESAKECKTILIHKIMGLGTIISGAGQVLGAATGFKNLPDGIVTGKQIGRAHV